MFQSVVSYCSYEFYRFFFGFFPFQKQLRSKCVFLCSPQIPLILIHEFGYHYQSRKQKGSPDAFSAATAPAAECAGGQERTPPGGAALRPEAPEPATRTPARAAPSHPSGLRPSLTRPASSSGRAANGYCETWLPRRQCCAGTQRRSSGSELGEKGVNPKYIARPHLGGNTGAGLNQGRRRQGHSSGSQTASCCETCYSTWVPFFPLPGAHASSPSPGCAGTALPDVAHVQTRGHERRRHPRAHPAPRTLARPAGALLTSGASWSRCSLG